MVLGFRDQSVVPSLFKISSDGTFITGDSLTMVVYMPDQDTATLRSFNAEEAMSYTPVKMCAINSDGLLHCAASSDPRSWVRFSVVGSNAGNAQLLMSQETESDPRVTLVELEPRQGDDCGPPRPQR